MVLSAAISSIENEISIIKQNTKLASAHVALMGASKNQPLETIEEAIGAGMSLFGENRVQEAAEKWPDLRTKHPRVEVHLIGPLQTNKVKQALGLFDVIQTLDRPKLALAIAEELKNWRIEELEEKDTTPQFLNSSFPQFYIQVNTGKEPQKAGVMPEEADAFIAYCRELGLPVTGLMCIPPANQPPAPHFALLREIARRNHLLELSMGMSEDWKEAVRMGSTCIRIGTALFGKRTTPG